MDKLRRCGTSFLMIPSLLLLPILIRNTGAQSSAKEEFNVAGFFEFEAPEFNSSTVSEGQDASTMFMHAQDYAQMGTPQFANSTEFNSFQYNITNQDGFYLAQKMCGDALNQLQIGASMGVRTKSLREYMHIVSDAKQVPYFELMPSLDRSRKMVIQMHPDPQELVELIKNLIQDKLHTDWNWQNFFIVYESDEALETYLKLLSLHNSNGMEVSSHHIQSEGDYTETFQYMREVESKQIIVDCSLKSIMGFMNKALEMQMLTSDYHYHFTSLDLHILNLTHYSYGGAKITWSQLVKRMGDQREDKSNGVIRFENHISSKSGVNNPPASFFTTHNALMVDSMRLLRTAISDLERNSRTKFTTKSLSCDLESDIWPMGLALRNAVHNTQLDYGMTGWVQFTKHGQRTNYTLYIMQLQPGGTMKQIGTYKPPDETNPKMSLQLVPTPQPPDLADIDDWKNKVNKVTTILSDPYLKRKKNHVNAPKNEQYEGYVADLMVAIVEQIREDYSFDLKYELNEVKDGQYGSPPSSADGEWNGMVGEVMRREADMAVAPLTINYEREQVIDFTKPFMTFGIAILYKVPEKEPPNMLSFMEPINYFVWGTIIVSVIVVSLSMYIFSRFSPSEWENPFPCQEDYEFLENEFNLPNAFWFSVGSIMQQGCDIMPKAPSTRIVAISWWLFTLIIISSYTANLAAFLTITTPADTIKSADDLAGQTAIKYGCKTGGNTCEFFKNSEIKTYKEMWNFMNTTQDALSDNMDHGKSRVKEGGYAYLAESSSLQYQVVTDEACELTQVGPPLNSLSYGIGVPEKHPLREVLSSTVLRLNEKQVLLELYNKWWKVNDDPCKSKSKAPGAPQLRLKNLEGIFVFLAGGLAISCLVVCIEIIAYAVQRSKREKVSACKLLALWFKNSVKGTFPTSLSQNSLDQKSMSMQGNHIMQNNKANIANSIIEEEMEPLNGHVDRVPVSETTDTLLHH